MAQIHQLNIRSIRSFGEIPETITIGKPLTLIVGTNGSGKTTIIECLRYVTTGDLPPNSKQNGGAFVHDPKLAGESEVLAEIKMSFTTTAGVRRTVSRRLKVTVTPNKRHFGELEGNIAHTRNGDRHSMSVRVKDLNRDMPHYLGVSAAVLSNVIFCHQEESLWPLAPPKDLKEKFDAIFEALKYTTAIAHLKVIARKQKEEQRLLEKDEEYCKANKNQAKKVEKQIRELHAQCDDLRTQFQDYKDRIAQATRNLESAWDKVQAASTIVGELHGKRIEEHTKKESVESLLENLQEMSDTDEELQRMLEQYEERVQHYQSDLQSQKDRYGELNHEIQRGRNRVSAKERECGSYEAQAESYQRQLQSREQLVKATARSHNIYGFDVELDDKQVMEFMDRITKKARDQNTALERARRENQEEQQGKQQDINQINEQKSALNSRKESARQSININDRKINSLQAELNRIDMDEGARAAMELSVQETKSRFDSAKSEMEQAGWDRLLQEVEAELRGVDDSKDRLDAELVEGTRRATELATLNYIQKELKARQVKLNTNVGAHGEKITSLIGAGWAPATIEEFFTSAIEQHTTHVAEAEKQRDGTIREKEQIDFQLNSCRKDLKEKQKALKKASDAIRRLDIEPDEYTDRLREAEESREILKTDTNSNERLKQYFLACIKGAKDKAACRTCGRGLKPKESATLESIMQREIRKLDADLGDAPKQLAKIEQEIEAAKAVASDHEMWERLKQKEIPDSTKLEEKLVQQRDKLMEQLEAQDIVVGERRDAKRDVEAITRNVESIAKLHKDIVGFEAQVAELLAKQKSAIVSRGLEEIQDDVKKVNEEARTLRARLNSLNSDRERARSLVTSLELEYRDLQSKLSTAEYQLKEKIALERQVDDLRTLNAEHRETIKSLDRQLQDLAPQLAQAQAIYDDAVRRGTDKDRQYQAEASKLNNSVNELKLVNQEIEAYLARGGPEQLKRAKREVDDLKDEVARLLEEQGEIVKVVKDLEEQLRNHSETRRAIADNQRYRRDLRQLQRVREEIAELETHNAEVDKARYEKEGQRWQMERNKLAAEQASVTGALKAKDDSLISLLEDYETQYKDAARKYKEAHVKVEATKACVEDLARFGGALDKAIMHYHSIKMEEINRIIDELWRKTYQGTDVDTILIRSESETVKANKSYNYRVCMVKQDAEMDMRGRCSAGQKVLASIIIRLALAECFGVNCGLIALDEPTTNLDRDNIRALAESLAEIIKIRRQQKNFQLIVITHDEEFLRYMGCSDFTDVYYRVSRNESQTSVIEKQNISEVV